MPSPSPIRAGVVGASGYTGAELVRLLLAHQRVQLLTLSSRRHAGQPIGAVHPQLLSATEQVLVDPAQAPLEECDVVFFATPHGVAMHSVGRLLEAGVRVIDLSADFRLQDAALWARWYGVDHAAPERLPEAVYGLVEYNRAEIAAARLVANPGCYPTAVLLALLPLLEADAIDAEPLHVSAVSGLSGAGRELRLSGMLTEAAASVSAYGLDGHRHVPEMEQLLRRFAAAATLTFVPHLVPMSRGMYATVFVQLKQSTVDVTGVLQARYHDQPFVDVISDTAPRSGDLSGSNLCRLCVSRPGAGDSAVVLSALDNLVKGAAGQAVQNMNIMFGCEETEGLSRAGLRP